MWTSSVCFLCVKTFSCCNKDPNPDKYQLKLNTTSSSRSFRLFSERFLKLPQDSPLISVLCSNERSETKKRSSRTSSSSFLDQFCSDCSEILQATVKLYNELCEVQLKMAWRLGQWEALLKMNETSKPSSKLSSLLYQKLSKQLQLDPGMGGGVEVRKMRNFLLSHCKNARIQMSDHRKLEVAMDGGFPVAGQGKSFDLGKSGSGTAITTFLVLDSNSPLSEDVDKDADVVVKRELELDDQEFECDDAEDFACMDFEADDDFSSTHPKQESMPSSFSTETVAAVAKQRRSTTNNDVCYLPKIKKPPAKKVKVKRRRVKKEKNIKADSGISCELCGKVVGDFKKLQRHLENDLNRKFKSRKGQPPTFQCHFCWKSFILEQQRLIHEHTGSHDKYMKLNFTCYEEVCNGKPPFSSFNDLEAHFEDVHETKNEAVHKCSRCQWPFTSNDMRQVHELIHEHFYTLNEETRAKPFKCPNCGQYFSKFSALQTHFILEHTKLDDARIYKCQKCSMSYNTALSLDNHLKTHEMEEDLANIEETGAGSSNTSKYHVCDECGKHCANPRILSKHKFFQHRKVQCTICGKIQSTHSLSKHMKQVHKVGDTSQAQHSCPICEKKFRTKANLNIHIMEGKHLQESEKEKGEICHICSKKYERIGPLHRHLKVAHQIEAEELKRPARFICPDCGMGYYYKSSLAGHVDAKHRNLEERKQHFRCSLCSRTFWRKSMLRKHLEEAHSQHGVKVKER